MSRALLAAALVAVLGVQLGECSPAVVPDRRAAAEKTCCSFQPAAAGCPRDMLLPAPAVAASASKFEAKLAAVSGVRAEHNAKLAAAVSGVRDVKAGMLPIAGGALAMAPLAEALPAADGRMLLGFHDKLANKVSGKHALIFGARFDGAKDALAMAPLPEMFLSNP